MKTARWCSLEEAVASIPDGASLATGGFMLGRAPMALVMELIAQERRGLRLISLPNPLPAEFLVAGGCLAHLDIAFGALSLEGRVRPMPCIKRAIEQNTLSWREHDGYRVVQRLRAASMGLPFIPAPDADVSGLARAEPPRTVVDPFTGESVPVEPAYFPDVALIHARAADERGNLFMEDPTTDLLVAGAARRVIATVEERVSRLPRVTIPGFQVDRIILSPRGALPTGCVGLYPHDDAMLARYLSLAEAGQEAEFLHSLRPRRAA
ncbi:glutaconate CoA transferase subunit A [Myxococcus stipitatus DSM 14675]|uniref:Glutaconate CoA transferase subunit A n=1 Tax=Myxococcus stipitatus (strain DSM 14675 / JCM 12634 / Mx s8) TaxID=1278073 RepID=L7UAX9_MYXSD|nr:malonate decarboxylase subunit alpha [Myxococcus stipitatus]AGC45000.1 glutaconate CoA transferase subunit A [Myxococcus stipitatus DSM 14675]